MNGQLFRLYKFAKEVFNSNFGVQGDVETSTIGYDICLQNKIKHQGLWPSWNLEIHIKTMTLSPVQGSVIRKSQIQGSSRSDKNLLKINDINFFICSTDVKSRVLTSYRSVIKGHIFSFPDKSFTSPIPFWSEGALN